MSATSPIDALHTHWSVLLVKTNQFASPRDVQERTSLANTCVRNLKINFPAVVDEFGNSTEAAYAAWPDRIYVIDGDGRVAYKSRPGPFGFAPRELELALEHVLRN